MKTLPPGAIHRVVTQRHEYSRMRPDCRSEALKIGTNFNLRISHPLFAMTLKRGIRKGKEAVLMREDLVVELESMSNADWASLDVVPESIEKFSQQLIYAGLKGQDRFVQVTLSFRLNVLVRLVFEGREELKNGGVADQKVEGKLCRICLYRAGSFRDTTLLTKASGMVRSGTVHDGGAESIRSVNLVWL